MHTVSGCVLRAAGVGSKLVLLKPETLPKKAIAGLSGYVGTAHTDLEQGQVLGVAPATYAALQRHTAGGIAQIVSTEPPAMSTAHLSCELR